MQGSVYVGILMPETNCIQRAPFQNISFCKWFSVHFWVSGLFKEPNLKDGIPGVKQHTEVKIQTK